MSEKEIARLADEADMIIAGYAYTRTEGQVKVLNLNDTKQACILAEDGQMLSTNMNEVTLALVQAYYHRNKKYMEDMDA